MSNSLAVCWPMIWDLGKTVQVIAFMLLLKEKERGHPPGGGAHITAL
jgi:hypothetical protein